MLLFIILLPPARSTRTKGGARVFISCKYCGGIHQKGVVCSRKPQKQYKKRTSKIDKFRKTAEWQRKRIEVLERDKYLCRLCFPAVINNSSIQVHHIVPMKEDWERRLDNDNLVSLCTFHHQLAEDGEVDREELFNITNIPPTVQFSKFTSKS